MFFHQVKFFLETLGNQSDEICRNDIKNRVGELDAGRGVGLMSGQGGYGGHRGTGGRKRLDGLVRWVVVKKEEGDVCLVAYSFPGDHGGLVVFDIPIILVPQ
jgi:hypothetical protein